MHQIVSLLIQKLGTAQVLYGSDLHDCYTHIWKMDESLQARALIRARHTQDVADTLAICHQYHQNVVVHGGRTNLVGSTETVATDIVLSLERMNTIEEIDPATRTMTVQAGCVLQDVQDAAAASDLLFPLNFGAKGSAQIGGIIATNAGGLRVFRYGMMRQLVLGLEVVLPSGKVISSMKKIIKDNSAYDIKQLFVGSEGTLGVVTRAVLKVVEAPRSRQSAFVGLDSYDKAIQFLKYMDKNLAGTLSGFELIWKTTYQQMTTPPAPNKPPIRHGYAFYVLLETLGGDPHYDGMRLEQLLTNALEAGMISDAVPAQTSSDIDWFWSIRENVHVLVSQCPYDQHFDISLPIADMGHYAAKIRSQLLALPSVTHCFTFGHIADGNIHLVIGKQDASAELTEQINTLVYSPLQQLGGSISAEHGIGLHKKAYLHLSRSKAEIKLMRTLKQSLDPHGVLNRGKVLDA